MESYFKCNRVTLYHGDAKKTPLSDNGIDTIITDPPYGLAFMGKDWDHGVPGVAFWREALRVAKPGALLLAFGGTRTFHRLAVAIEDAGWELRDSIGLPHASGDWGDCPWLMAWCYGSGFPKSLDIGKAIDKAAGAEREVVGKYQYPDGSGERSVAPANAQSNIGRVYGSFDITAPATDAAKLWDGRGTALKPAWEPVVVAMKPLDGTFANNALTHGVAGLWIDGGRVGTDDVVRSSHNVTIGGNGIYGGGKQATTGAMPGEGRWPANLILTYPESEYIMREDLTKEQKSEVFQWLQENA